MLEHLRQIAIFARTVEQGSFRKAAETLRLSPSVVSHHVAQLEQSLGVALLYRSTRRITLTPDGTKLFEAARRMLEAADDGLQALSTSTEAPSGELRVTAPAFLSQSELLDRVAAFARKYPKVRLDLDFTDDRRHLLRDGFDLAIRAGWLTDSQMISRKLGEVERRLIGSTAYLDGREMPIQPEDVADWDWIGLASVRPEITFVNGDGVSRRIKLAPRVRTNSVHAMYRLVEAAAGVAVLPVHMTDSGVAAGTIQPVLPEWHPQPIGTYAVWPPNAPRQGLTGRFVDFLAERRPTT